MSKYRLILDWPDKPLTELLALLSSVGITTDRVSLEPEAGYPPQSNPQAKTDRNQEIIQKYTMDPARYSTPKLAEEYGITRERVAQILRKVNAIGAAQVRREAAKEALVSERAALKAKVSEEWEKKITEALALIKKGMSVRQAAVTVGLEPHSSISNTLAKRAKMAGVKLAHGRHRDFSDRKARAKALHERGFTIPQIVAHMRKNGDPRIHEVWVYNNMPELRKYSRPRLRK